MNERLAAAQAALNSGRAADAIENLVAAVEADPAQAVGVTARCWSSSTKRTAMPKASAGASAAVARFPRDLGALEHSWASSSDARSVSRRALQALWTTDATEINPRPRGRSDQPR